MKVEDLMIGDLVYYSYPNSFVTKVIDVCSHGEEHFIRCKRDEKDNLYKQDQLEDFNVGILRPIPLTPEILEKNGFEKHISDTRMFFQHDEYHLSYYIVNKHFTIYNQIDGSLIQRVIVNVHELQHALKLCGIDKEIII